jgi:hypothetical protein
VPSLVVGGARDWLFPPEFVREVIAAPLTRARVTILDSGHEIPVEMPAELAGLTSAFIEEWAGATGGRIDAPRGLRDRASWSSRSCVVSAAATAASFR